MNFANQTAASAAHETVAELNTQAKSGASPGSQVGERIDEIRVPGLAYQHALDWLAVRLHSSPGTVACVAPAAWQVQELQRRLPAVHTLPIEPGSCAAVAWLEPQHHAAGEFGEIVRGLQSGGRVHLVVGGLLARFLNERRAAGERTPMLSQAGAQRMLQQHGFSITERIGLHGWRSIGWHGLAGAAAAAGRHDWQDRCHYAMRRAFVETLPTGSAVGRGAAPAPVALLCLTAERAP